MAKLMVIGEAATVEITRDPLDGDLTTRCVGHRGVIRRMKGGSPDLPPCGWSETHDDLSYSVAISEDHADGKR